LKYSDLNIQIFSIFFNQWLQIS